MVIRDSLDPRKRRPTTDCKCLVRVEQDIIELLHVYHDSILYQSQSAAVPITSTLSKKVEVVLSGILDLFAIKISKNATHVLAAHGSGS